MAKRSPGERFWAKVEIKDYDGCWLWTGALTYGYGTFDRQRAHRWAYETIVGPIPAGLVLDHVCHNRDLACPGGNLCPNRSCVNPNHLRATNVKANTLAGRGPTSVRAQQTHCIRGHELTRRSTPSGNRRLCLVCNAARDRRNYLARKAALAATTSATPRDEP